jgi:uncharacterized protein YjbI with pentapeptide repeats
MQYADMVLDAFDVPAEPGADPGKVYFRLRVLGSPAGELSAAGAVAGAYDRKALQASVRQVEARALDRAGLIAFGQQLADWLLPAGAGGAPGPRELYERSLAQIGQDGGLRLRLQLTPALAWIPWEYIYIGSLGGAQQSEMEGFLALNPRVAIVRYEALPLEVPRLQPPDDATLKIVGALALQADAQQLDLQAEQAALGKIFDVRGVSHTFLEQATLQGILDHAADAHVLHFAGHGEFATAMADEPGSYVGAGRVMLADAAVGAEQLSMNVRGTPLRLVVLGACESGKRGGANVINPWDAIVPRLIGFGVPAVVANQFKIQDNCAIAFSTAFYSALFGGLSVERAMVAGRLAIYNADPSGREWGVPVLYMRAADGRLFIGVSDPAARGQARAAAEQVIQANITITAGDGAAAAVVNNAGSGDVKIDQSVKNFNFFSAPEADLTPNPPPVPRHYVARSKLEQKLRAALEGADDTAPAVIVWGSDGVGKGSLVAQVVKDLLSAGDFTGGVAWADLAERTVDELLRLLLSSLGPRWSKAGARLWPTLKERDRPTLVVVDNVRDTRQLRQLMPGEAELPTSSRLLVISDLQLIKDQQSDQSDKDDIAIRRQLRRPPIYVEPFEPDQTVELFEQVLAPGVVRKYRDDLVLIGDFYSHLPPLVASASQRLAETRQNPSAFLRQLKEHESQHDALGEELIQARELLIHDLSPLQQEVFALTSLFGEGSWSAEMLAYMALRPLQEVRAALSMLVHRELLAIEDDGRFRIQTLFREIAQRRFDARTPYERAAAERLFARWCLDRAQDVWDELHSGNFQPLDQAGEAASDFYSRFRDALRADMPHIRKVLEWAADQSAWEILGRFGNLAYMELVRRLIWNHSVGYIRLQLATIEQLAIGPYNQGQPSQQDFLPNDGLLGYVDEPGSPPQFVPVHRGGSARARPLLQRATGDKPDIHFELTAGVIRAGVIVGADLVNARWFGVQAGELIMYDTHLIGALLVACRLANSVWNNCDLSRSNLDGSDLRYSILKGVRLRGARLREVNLTGAVLDGVDLRDADLTGANLTGAQLNKVNLLNARLDQVVWAGVNLGEGGGGSVVLDESVREDFAKGRKAAPGVEVVQVYGGSLPDRDAGVPTWSVGDYSNGDLRAAKLEGSRFGRSVFSNVDLRASMLEGAALIGTNMAGAKFGAARMRFAKIVDALLRGADLRVAQLDNARIAKADLQAADLRSASLTGAFIFLADLSRATLYATNLSESIIWHTKLAEADLRFANVSGASLIHVDLTGAFVSLPQLQSLARLRGSTLPSGLRYTGQFGLPGDLEDARTMGIDLADGAALAAFYQGPVAPSSPELEALEFFQLVVSESRSPRLRQITEDNESPRLRQIIERVRQIGGPELEQRPDPRLLLDTLASLQQVVDSLPFQPLWHNIGAIAQLSIELARPRIYTALFQWLDRQVGAASELPENAKHELRADLAAVQAATVLADGRQLDELAQHLVSLVRLPELFVQVAGVVLHDMSPYPEAVRTAILTVFYLDVQEFLKGVEAPRRIKRVVNAVLSQILEWLGNTDTADMLVAQLAQRAAGAPEALELVRDALQPDFAERERLVVEQALATLVRAA